MPTTMLWSSMMQLTKCCSEKRSNNKNTIRIMKKQYINPVCKVMTLNTKQHVLDSLFGNTSFIPVGNVVGDNEYEDAVDDMFSNKATWE